MRATFIISLIGTFLSTVSRGEISLLAETTPLDPNEEFTVWVYTDEPLLFLELDAYVTGDATITSAMSEADCNEFGWDNGWGIEPIIDNTNGWVSIGGICWSADANDIVGYFKFRYQSGHVAVYIDQEHSIAGNWGNNFTFSDEVLSFGEIVLPPLKEPNVPVPVLIQCPLGSGGPSRGESNSFPGWSQRVEISGMLDSEPTVIEINSNITTNQVWDASNVYYVTEPNGINVQALLVIEPGATVIFGYRCGLFINNGGVLISCGTPDKPIVFTPDWVYYDYPDYIGCYWQVFPSYGPHYFCPIYIESTASTATTTRYCMIEGAVGGIVTENLRLDNPIENNYLLGNVWGIYEFGPMLTDIRNNLCFFQDQAAIEVELCTDPNDVPDTDNIFTIEQNTCDAYQYCGITVHGVAEPNEVPEVHLLNNIVSGAYWYGLNLVDGYMQMFVVNTGYFENYYDKNWEFDEYNPVYAEMNPYYPYVGEKPYQHHYLADDSAFVDAGTQYIEQTKLIGMTTNFDSLPDKDLVDLGFHSMDWTYIGGEGIAGTDMDDVAEIVNYWLTYTPYDPNIPYYQDPNIVDPNTISYGGDWNNDGFVDLADFAILAGMWQKTQAIPEITASINVSSEDGSIEVQVQDEGAPIYQCFLLIDGVFVKELIFSEDIFQRTVYMPWLSPGLHEARIIGSGQQGIVCSAVISFEIDNAIGPCIVPLIFEMGEPLSFFANSDVDVRVSAWVSGQEVWSEIYPSGMVHGTVPAAVTNANDIEFLMFAPEGQFAMRSGAGASPVAVPVNSEDHEDGDYTALMIRPNITINFSSGLADYVYEKLVEMGYKVKKLRFYNSSFKNVKKYIDKNTIKVLYYDGHGNYKYPKTKVYRSILGLDDGDIVSDKVSNYPSGQAPSWLEPLPPKIEASVKTWRELNLKDLKFAAFDACYAMRLKINDLEKLEESTSQAYTYRSDLSMALLQRGEFVDQWVFGWAGKFVSGYGTPWQGFSITMWEELGKKENLADAVSEAYGKAPSEVRNAYRLQGHDDPFDFKL